MKQSLCRYIFFSTCLLHRMLAFLLVRLYFLSLFRFFLSFWVNTKGEIINFAIFLQSLSRCLSPRLTITFIFWTWMTLTEFFSTFWRFLDMFIIFPTLRHVQRLWNLLIFVRIFYIFELLFKLCKLF